MKLKFVAATALMAASTLALAQQYVCTVNCLNPSGKTTTVVNAGSASEAAKIVDKQSDRVCQAAGHGKSTSSSMSASQCSKK